MRYIINIISGLVLGLLLLLVPESAPIVGWAFIGISTLMIVMAAVYGILSMKN